MSSSVSYSDAYDKEYWEYELLLNFKLFIRTLQYLSYLVELVVFFSSPDCDDFGLCFPTRVVQYDPYMDEWVDIETIGNPRRLHEVIEVPASFCEMADPPQVTET